MTSLITRTILITGANRGIGFSITQSLSQRFPTSSTTYILACRSTSAGQEAVQELQKLDIKANLDVVELDITNDSTILNAVEYVQRKYGHLDVLINNAGIGLRLQNNSLGEIRSNFNATFNANITSIFAVTSAFLPLLHRSPEPKVINISSGRASLTRSSEGKLPPTAVVSYSVSKAAVNSLTIEMQKGEDALLANSEGSDGGVGRGKVEYFAANPGHCKTAFNGFRGTKDPLEGAEVVVRLVGAERGAWKRGGFWEFEEGEMREVPW